MAKHLFVFVMYHGLLIWNKQGGAYVKCKFMGSTLGVDTCMHELIRTNNH